MIDWLQTHVWFCTYIIAGLAILTFVLNFIIKRNKQDSITQKVGKTKMKASHNKKSAIYQSVGDMTINLSKDETK